LSNDHFKLQIASYEDIDFEQAIQYPRSWLISAYVIRKALIRKHYLSNTVSTWLVKHPQRQLSVHFKPCTHFELDYAEFLDEALVDAWDLNESMGRNEGCSDDSPKEWWILKPGMSDGGNGIRLFSSLQELQSIFEEWEEAYDNEEAEEVEHDGRQTIDDEADLDNTNKGAMTSQLRHFIAQPYIQNPLLLNSHNRRKFHIRTYVLAVGALRVYVYRDMLALFAAKSYQRPGPDHDAQDLAGHLTNTCFQDESTKADSVYEFWKLESSDLPADRKTQIFEQICGIAGEVFEAAAKEQMIHFQAIPNAFEIFGVDFLVDSEVNVWLLELNAYPDFKQTGKSLQDAVVGGLFEEVMEVAIKPFFDPASAKLKSGSERMRLVNHIHLGRG
jgi:tubulin---tyrosine ligase